MIPEEIIEILETPSAAGFRRMALEAGFALAGVARAGSVSDYVFYDEWVRDGLAGPLGYLTDHRGALRADARNLLPSARSVLSVGLLYGTKTHTKAPFSCYSWGVSDYHDILHTRLQELVYLLQERWGTFEYRICVDTAPLLERSLAREAGLGWIGRNTCLIDQRYGSYLFLGEVLISLDLEPGTPAPDRCGTCRRCLDACPTQALVEHNGRTQLDASLCISTFTIEKRGELTDWEKAACGEHVFGCDVCQEVCPWNRKAPLTEDACFQPVEENFDLLFLAALTPEEFRARFRRSPVWRTKYTGLLRNVATVLGNSNNIKYLPVLERLTESEDPTIRAHALWALERLKSCLPQKNEG